MSRFAFVATVLVALGACKATPTLDGVSLICSDDSTCPEGMRCYQEGCITNSPPRIAALGLRFVDTGAPVVSTPVVVDADQDPITLSWTQLEGGADLLVTQPFEGATLQVTADETPDTYVFEVVADDGYDTSAPAYLTLIALPEELDPPNANLVYVSDTGNNSADCGGADEPCATIAHGLGQGTTIVLAATQRLATYDHCLGLGGGQTVWGGFDADTWRYDPLLIGRTKIACKVDSADPLDPEIGAIGHVLDDTSAGHVTLSLDVDLESWPERTFVTVALVGAAPTLWGVDVVAPAVSQPSVSAGVLSDTPRGRMLGVDVRGDPGGLDTPLYSVAVGVFGGVLEIQGIEQRGRLILNAPTTVTASGIESVTGATVIVDGIEISGGVASGLVGVHASGGVTTVRNTIIDLRSFGTFYAEAIVVNALCDLTTCTAPELTAVDNVIRLHGAALAVVPTCVGVAIGVKSSISGFASAPETTTIAGNTIELDGDIGLAVGVSAIGGGATITNNSIHIAQSLVHLPGCPDYVAAAYPTSPTVEGALGISLGAAKGDTLSANAVAIESRAGDTFGIYVGNVSGALVSENFVEVGIDPVSNELYWPAVAALLETDLDELDASTFERNDLRVGANAGRGIGLELRGFTPWEVVNNHIYGGDADFNTGLRLEVFHAEAQWPRVVHNTIFGGSGRVSTALHITTARQKGDNPSETDPPGGDVGVFVNNLLDAGDASGRRFVLDNQHNGTLADTITNVAQLAGDALPPPRPAAALLTGDVWDLLQQKGRLHLALPGSGSMAAMTVRLDNLRQQVELADESWVPVGPFDIVWMGTSDGTGDGEPLTLVGANNGAISIAYVGQGAFDDFTTTTIYTPTGEPLVPRLLAVAEAAYGPPADVVVATAAAAPGPGGLYVLPSTGFVGQGLSEVVTAAVEDGRVELIDPGFLGISRAELNDGGDRLYIIDQPQTSARLVTWPALVGGDSIVIPQIVTAFAAGNVFGGGEAVGGERTQRILAAVRFDPEAPAFDHAVYLLGGSGSPSSPQTLPGVCFDSAVSTVAILATPCIQATWCPDLWVGCENGQVQAFFLDKLSGAWAFSQAYVFDPTTPFDPVPETPTPTLPVSSLTSHNAYVIVGYENSPLVTIIPPRDGTDRTPMTFGLVADVGMLDHSELRYVETTPVPSGTCNLGLRDPPVTADHPLDLVDGPDDCDLGTSTSGATEPYLDVPRDLHGDDRNSAQPTIGADERTQ